MSSTMLNSIDSPVEKICRAFHMSCLTYYARQFSMLLPCRLRRHKCTLQILQCFHTYSYLAIQYNFWQAGLFLAYRKEMVMRQWGNLYIITRIRVFFGGKLSHLHTCEMAGTVVKCLAVYDCIQLSNHAFTLKSRNKKLKRKWRPI